MHEITVEEDQRPFVATSIARHLLSRFKVTHEMRGISVFSGPWGMGKTKAINAFARDAACVVATIEPGAKKGASPIALLRHVVEAVQLKCGYLGQVASFTGYWPLRNMLHAGLCRLASTEVWDGPGDHPPFSIIFDEAQYLSRDAIELIRFWNDGDSSTTPFPVGLIFVGNNEFSLEEDTYGQSTISGAVRSRALFIEPLDYSDISDQDLVLFAQSRGVADAGAIAEIVRYYSSPRIKRDLRNVERLLASLKRRANGAAVCSSIVHEFLQPV